jgi:hypothetical protein
MCKEAGTLIAKFDMIKEIDVFITMKARAAFDIDANNKLIKEISCQIKWKINVVIKCDQKRNMTRTGDIELSIARVGEKIADE